MIEEMTDKGMWINFRDDQRIEVEYLPDDDKLRVSHYPAGSDSAVAWTDVEPEHYRDDGSLHPRGIFRPYGVHIAPENELGVFAYFAYDVVTLKWFDPVVYAATISAYVHCSRLLDVVKRE
jgi:hypothetical protein